MQVTSISFDPRQAEEREAALASMVDFIVKDHINKHGDAQDLHYSIKNFLKEINNALNDNLIVSKEGYDYNLICANQLNNWIDSKTNR